MNPFQPIYDIAPLCAARGLHYAVLCPGSRCAPLTLAFTRYNDIHTRTFSDERSAAFIALGIAQRTKAPSILVCTSGSAAYNFAPAVAEAFFSETPMLILTADRPMEWIGQHDGQTLYQPEVFGKHVKKSFNLPADYFHPDSVWAINRIVNEAINLSLQEPAGPVHINTPFREPLYPRASDQVSFSNTVRTIDQLPPAWQLDVVQKQFLAENLFRFNRVLVVAGQTDSDSRLRTALHAFSEAHQVPVVGDVISNLHPLDNVVRYSDMFLAAAPGAIRESLQPDLLITFGKSVISKQLKLFLRKHKASQHWHIQPGGAVADTFQGVTHIINSTAEEVFAFLATERGGKSFDRQKQQNFGKLWEVEERRVQRVTTNFFPTPELGELEVVAAVMSQLPEDCNLHLANSMSVRYANMIGLAARQKNVSVYANRGTSGIDGCTSTVVGHCLDNSKPNILITGDMAFFYDRNAFWHNYALPNLRVVVLNNHGGIIFNLIDGPSSLPESAEYFVTRQNLTARKLCEEFEFDHLKLDNRRKLNNLLRDFFEFDGRTKVLELESDQSSNRSIFDNFKTKIKNTYEA